MDMDEYNGPTVAVLVREHPTIWGAIAVEVVSVHRNDRDAATGLAARIIAGDAASSGWRVVTVPAPGLAADGTDQRDADLAAALGMDEPAAWPTMCRKVRGLRQATDEAGEPYVLADLRKALAPAQHHPAMVERMTPTQLLDLVRTLVEVVNTPPAPVALDPEGIERAARTVGGSRMSSESWENLDGRTQELYVADAERVVRAYLAADEG